MKKKCHLNVEIKVIISRLNCKFEIFPQLLIQTFMFQMLSTYKNKIDLKINKCRSNISNYTAIIFHTQITVKIIVVIYVAKKPIQSLIYIYI